MATETYESCYPDEIKTLHEMLKDERERMAPLQSEIDRRSPHAPAGILWAHAMCERKIEALRTAIEALGGAL